MEEKQTNSFGEKYGLPVLGLSFLLIYILGTFFPDFWWTTHWLAFVPDWLKYILLAIVGLSMLLPFYKKEGLELPESFQQIFDNRASWIIAAVAFCMGLLMYNFPIAHDYYGDSYKVLQHLDQEITIIPSGTNDAFFTYGLSPWDGHTTILAIVTYIAFFLGITYRNAFLILDAVCGSLYLLLWLSFVRYYLKQVSWQLVMGLMGMLAPFTLIYYGHIESYAPVFLFFLAWMLTALWYLETKKVGVLWGLVGLLLICIKLHPVALLFGPALGLLFVRHFRPSSRITKKLEFWEGIIKWILIPIFTAGAILYFFVFEDYNDPRSLNDTAMEFDRLFLPLISPDPPLERYNLLSFNHIFDYFCEILLWSPLALFLVLTVLIFYRKNMYWNAHPIQITGLSLLLFASLFFVVNPLLSMQLDWDLLAIPGPIFLCLAVVLIKQADEPSLAKKVLPLALGFSLLSMVMIGVHASPHTHSQRLESIGIRMYKSYYEWSSKVISFALNIPEYASRQAYETRKNKVLAKLKPLAVKEVDFEYARLLAEDGKYYTRTAKNYPKAIEILSEARYYFPYEKNALLYLMESNFLAKDYGQAFNFAMKLVEIQYPSEKKSIAIATQCALEAGNYEEALNLSNFYLTKWQDSEAILGTNQRLKGGKDLDQIKYLFKRQE